MIKDNIIGAVQAYQLVHDQTGGKTHIDMKTAQVTVTGHGRPDLAVSDVLVAPIYKNRHKLRRHEGLMPEFLALVGTGATPETLPLKRFALDQTTGALVDMVAQIPTPELISSFAKFAIPFQEFWIEMPYQDLKTGARLRYAHWCQTQHAAVIAKNYYWLWADKKTENGLQAIQFAEPEKFLFTNKKIDLLDMEIDGIEFERASKSIEILTKRAKRLLAALVVLGSPRFNSQVFAPETPEEQAERLAEYNKNIARMRLGRPPLLPFHPIKVEIGPRLEEAIRTGNIKDAKNLLGITSVRKHPMRIRRANGDIDVVMRREHDRHFPADEPIDRRGVVRQVTFPALPDLAPLRPAGNVPSILLYQPNKGPGDKKQ